VTPGESLVTKKSDASRDFSGKRGGGEGNLGLSGLGKKKKERNGARNRVRCKGPVTPKDLEGGVGGPN